MFSQIKDRKHIEQNFYSVAQGWKLGVLVKPYEEAFFHVFTVLANVKHVTPGAVPFLVPGAEFEQTW